MNISSTTSKRVLTLKSVLAFGRYSNVTIGELISRNKHSYIRRIYFTCEKIDFMPDILDVVGIPIEYRLIKPAKNPDILEIIDSVSIDSKIRMVETIKKKRKKLMKPVRKVDLEKFELKRRYGRR